MRLVFLAHSILLPSVFTIRVERKQASNFLQKFRSKRSNVGMFEEFQEGNLQRECVEEVCNLEEVSEALENDVEADLWYYKATHYCEEKNSCHVEGTIRCRNLWRGRECVCKPGWIKNEESDDCSIKEMNSIIELALNESDQISKKHTICDSPYQTGRCRGAYISYGYNSQTNKCDVFLFGGCKVNDNVFDSGEDCVDYCGVEGTEINDETEDLYLKGLMEERSYPIEEASGFGLDEEDKPK